MAKPLLPLLHLFVLATAASILLRSSEAADGACPSGPNASTITGFDYEAYLHRYGYFDIASDKSPPFSSHDYLLSVAIRTFQSNFGLAETGILNDETMLKMLVPRCGVSDYANGTTATGFRWPYYRLSYSYQSNFPEQAKPHVERAFGAWASVSPFTFYEVEDGFDESDISIGFDSGPEYGFDGPRNILAHATRPRDGIVSFDADDNWSFLPRNIDFYDFQTMALHEIGHMLGLGHSRDEGAVMFPSIAIHDYRDLSRDDVNAVKALYPPPAP